MSRAKILVKSLLGSLACLVLFVAMPTYAYSVRAEENVQLTGSECHEGDLYLSGNSIVVEQDVCGDVFAVGRTIEIDKPVRGSVFAAGQTVVIGGNVYGDIRVAGQDITLKGNVLGDVFAAGSTFSVRDGVDIMGDTRFAAGSAILSGVFEKTVKGWASTIQYDGQFLADVEATVDTGVSFGSNAQIAGDFRYHAKESISGIPEDRIQGAVVFTKVEQGTSTTSSDRDRFGMGIAGGLFHWFRLTVTFFLLTLIAGWLWKRSGMRVANIAKRPGGVFGWGLLILILVPIIALIACLTFFLLPLGLAIFALYVFALYFSSIIVVLWMTETWFGGMNKVLRILVFSVLLALVLSIPVLGGFVRLAVMLFGLGVIFLYVRERFQRQERVEVAPKSAE